MKGIKPVSMFLAVFAIAIVAVSAFFVVTGTAASTGGTVAPQTSTLAATLAGVAEPTEAGTGQKIIPISRLDVEYEMIAADPSAQDAEGDLDIDVLPFDQAKNAELTSKRYIDCAGVIPAVYNGIDQTVKLEEKNFCKVNQYLFWRDGNFNAGNSEEQLDDVLGAAKASDLDDVDGSGTKETTLQADKIYLVTVTEGATTDNEDVIPQAFLIGSVKNGILPVDSQDDQNIRFEGLYYSEASKHSRTRLGGEATDDANNGANTVSLDSNLNGMIHSSLSTGENVSFTGTVELEITKEGYAIPIVNTISTLQSQQAYLWFTPFGEGNGAGWREYTSGNLTGDVPYAIGNVDTAQILWQTSLACGIVITENSAIDAVREGGTNLYEPSCFKSSSKTRNGITGIWFDSPLVIPFSVTEVMVDQDLAANGNDEVVSGAGGGVGESFFNVTLYGLQSSEPVFVANITG